MKAVGIAGRMGTGKDTCASLLQREYGYVVVGFADALKRVAAKLFPDVPEALFWGPSEDRNRELKEPIDRHALEDAYARIRTGMLVQDLTWNGEITLAMVAKHLEDALTPHLPITTPRKLLQLLGSEWGRGLQDDVWLKALGRTAKLVAEGVPYFRRDGALTSLQTRLAPASVAIPDCRFLNEAKYIREELGGMVFWIDAAARVASDAKFAHASEPAKEDLGDQVDETVPNNASFDSFLLNIRLASLQHLGVVTS